MKTVNVSGRVPIAFSMSKYCVISNKSTTSLEEAPLICSFDVKSLRDGGEAPSGAKAQNRLEKPVPNLPEPH